MTPPEADLRDFRFMPLDVVRFAQSDLVAFAPPEAIVAAILLWGASWHQTPAGSLTNDDRTLSNLAGYGRAVGEWLKVKEEALRGFVLCSDGRLYHPVVAEKVRESWQGKLKQRHRTFTAAIRQHNSRNPDDQRTAPIFEEWLEQGQPTTVKREAREPQQQALALEHEAMSRATPENVTRDSEECHARVTPENAPRDREGTGKGQGQGQGDSTNDSSTGATNDPPPLARDDLVELTRAVARAGAVHLNPARPGPYSRELETVRAWVADGIDLERTAIPAIANRLATTAEDSIGSLRFYERDVRKAHARAIGPPGSAEARAAWSTERQREYIASLNP